jgi:hypothetical protein
MPTAFSWDTFVHAKSCHCVDVDELFSGSKKWRKAKDIFLVSLTLGEQDKSGFSISLRKRIS